MPPWVTALLVLVLISGLGAYIVLQEGFETAEMKCKTTFNTCVAACSSTNGGCLQTCGDAKTTCLQKAVAAATIANTDPLNGPFMNSSMAWAAAQTPGALGNGDPTYWYKSAYGSSSASGSVSNTTQTVSKNPSATLSTSTNNTSHTPSSPWDSNRNTYTSGWPEQNHDLQDDDSYDANAPVEGSYVVNVKRWKPHETPTQQAPGLKANAPTDAGTQADELRDHLPSLQQNVRSDVYVTDDIVPNSIRGLIDEDVKDTMDALFRNQYEIQYS
jgi:hypothetical protein